MESRDAVWKSAHSLRLSTRSTTCKPKYPKTLLAAKWLSASILVNKAWHGERGRRAEELPSLRLSTSSATCKPQYPDTLLAAK